MWIDNVFKKMSLETMTSNETQEWLKSIIPGLNILHWDKTVIFQKGIGLFASGGGSFTIQLNQNSVTTKYKIKKSTVDPVIVKLGQEYSTHLSTGEFISEFNYYIPDVNFYQWDGVPKLNNAINFTLNNHITEESKEVEVNQASDEEVYKQFFDNWQLPNSKCGMIKYPSFRIGNKNLNLLCDGKTTTTNTNDFLVQSTEQNYSGLTDQGANLQNFGMTTKDSVIVLYNDTHNYCSVIEPMLNEFNIEVIDNTVIVNNQSFTFSLKPSVTIYRRSTSSEDVTNISSNITNWWSQWFVTVDSDMYWSDWFTPYHYRGYGSGLAYFEDNVSGAWEIHPQISQLVLDNNSSCKINLNNSNNNYPWKKIIDTKGWTKKKLQQEIILEFPYNNQGKNNMEYTSTSTFPGPEPITFYEWKDPNGFTAWISGSTFIGHRHVCCGTCAIHDMYNRVLEDNRAECTSREKPSHEDERTITCNLTIEVPFYEQSSNIDSDNNLKIEMSKLTPTTEASVSTSKQRGLDNILSSDLECYWSIKKTLKGIFPHHISFITKGQSEDEYRWSSQERMEGSSIEDQHTAYQRIGIANGENSAYVIIITFDNREPTKAQLLLNANDFADTHFSENEITIRVTNRNLATVTAILKDGITGKIKQEITIKGNTKGYFDTHSWGNGEKYECYFTAPLWEQSPILIYNDARIENKEKDGILTAHVVGDIDKVKIIDFYDTRGYWWRDSLAKHDSRQQGSSVGPDTSWSILKWDIDNYIYIEHWTRYLGIDSVSIQAVSADQLRI